MNAREAPELYGDSAIVTDRTRLWFHRGAAPVMPLPHRHDDLEINIVLQGALDYQFGGTRASVPAGSLAVFWGATPHRLVATDAGADGDMCWIQVPLTTVLGWNLPMSDLSEVLLSQPIIVPATTIARDMEAMFVSWQQEMGVDGLETIALLEIQALIRRVLHWQRHSGEKASAAASGNPNVSADSMRGVTEMARFTVENFRKQISVVDIAASANLNPHYATTLFRRAVGSTIAEYLIRCRVAEAQRLLVTTTMTASEVAHAAGFGSQSSFYAQFTKRCGTSPGTYRSRLL
ncbi:helix-turn-helix domain-containing protein [Microbacterium sp. NPDC056234]|uniref:helix-turn-helix domain-containing protein n=1 Tax=Microbacterium sp. NPDC056234 TaxID=3345757 RepID=UPI0035D8D7BE